MNRNILLFTVIGLTFLFACSKDNDNISPDDEQSENTDLAIQLPRYEKGKLYNHDTIWNEFVIINQGSTTIKAGDTLKVGVDINGKLYGFKRGDIGASGFVLTTDFAPNSSYTYSQGFLLGGKSREVLKSDSMIVKYRVYGVNDVPINDSFDGDVNPENNETIVVNTKEGTIVTK